MVGEGCVDGTSGKGDTEYPGVTTVGTVVAECDILGVKAVALIEKESSGSTSGTL